jgi:hypothetical protein
MKVRTTSLLIAVIAVTVAVASMASAANLVQNGNFLNWTRNPANLAFQKGDFWEIYNTIGTIAPSQGSSFGSGLELLPLPDGSNGAWDTGLLDLTTSVQPQQCQRIKLHQTANVAVTPGVTITLDGWMASQLTQTSQAEVRMAIEEGQQTAPGPNAIWSEPQIGTTAWDRPVILDINTSEYVPIKITPTGNWVTIFLDGNHPTSDLLQCNVFFDDIFLGVPAPPAPPVGLSNKAANDTIITTASATVNFKVWGKVAVIDAGSFTLDDGSGTPIKVNAAGYAGIVNDDYASASGKLSGVTPNIVLTALPADVIKLN